MKICPMCRVEKSIDQFLKSGVRCKECQKSLGKGHYARNKESYKDRAKAQRLEAKAFIDALKQSPCADCGVKYPPYVMDFDHVPERGQKLMTISQNTKWRAKEKLLEEIKKCDLVCANCHRERTHARRNNS